MTAISSGFSSSQPTVRASDSFPVCS